MFVNRSVGRRAAAATSSPPQRQSCPDFDESVTKRAEENRHAAISYDCGLEIGVAISQTTVQLYAPGTRKQHLGKLSETAVSDFLSQPFSRAPCVSLRPLCRCHRAGPTAATTMPHGTGKITAKDISQAGSLQELIAQLVKKATDGSGEVKEQAANALESISQQNHGEHCETLFKAGSIGPLVGLLRDGTANAQSAAAGALAAIGSNSEEYQAAIVAKGSIGPIVALLKTGSAKVQEKAATALATLDKVVAHQGECIKAGCIPPLVGMLKNGSAAAQAAAAQAVANAAAYSRDSQVAIAAAGAVPLLLVLLGVGKAQMPAAACLAKLAANNAQIQTEISDAGGISPLLALLNKGSTEGQVQAAAALCELARDNINTQAAIAKAGGIGPLLALTQATGRGAEAAQSHAMGALAQLAHHNKDNQDAIARMGGVKPLVMLLESKDTEVQAHAAQALAEISRSNPDIQESIVDLAGIGMLASIIKGSQPLNVKAEVAGALWSLSEDATIKVTIAHAQAIEPLVKLLGENLELARHHASKALASLGLDNKENQVQITQLLIDMLHFGNDLGKERAVLALRTLIDENPNCHDVIARAGSAAALVDLLKTGIPDAKDYAVWSLSLSIASENQATIHEHGGVKCLVDQLSDKRVMIQEQAALALAKLATNNSATREEIQKAGGIKPLIALSRIHEQSSGIARQNAAAALSECALSPAAREEIVLSGGIRPLVLLLENEGRNTRKYVATTLARLSKITESKVKGGDNASSESKGATEVSNASTQAAIADAGAIVPLVALLDGKQGADAQKEAAGALFALAESDKNRKAITEADGVVWLVMLLGCDNPKAREHAEGALVRLSIDSANRNLIVKKLVDMLQETGTQAQEQSAAALSNLARESQDNRKAIIDANGIGPLLDMLDAASVKAKENSVGAITQLCSSKENQMIVAKAGGIPKLVSVLLGFTGTTLKEMAAVQLCTLAAEAIKEMAKDNRKNQDAISEAGAIQPLVAMLISPAPQMQANAAGALGHLAKNHPENQSAIARAGAIAPLCTLVKEGAEETKDQSAYALWSLSTDNAPNKDTIAKLGGIEPLLSLLVSGTSQKSQECVAGALTSLASKHTENRGVISKRLVGQLGSSAVKDTHKAVRVLMAVSSFAQDSSNNQVALAKAGGIQPLIVWLATMAEEAQREAAAAMLALATDNATTQVLISKSNAIPSIIRLVNRSSPEAQELSARTIWHLASVTDNHSMIVESGAISPLVGMLSADSLRAPEIAAIIMVRLARFNPNVSSIIADMGGIVPLIKLIANTSADASAGAQLQASALLAELALIPKNRDPITNANGIEPLVKLLISTTVGTPETAARVLGHLALSNGDDTVYAYTPVDQLGDGIRGSAERRTKINQIGGVKRLIMMLDGSSAGMAAVGKKKVEPAIAPKKASEDQKAVVSSETSKELGMQEQAAATLAEIALANPAMQDAIVEGIGVPPLLAVIRNGSPVGQEHAARAIWNLCASFENQAIIVECGCIPDLVALLKVGSPLAQEFAAAALSDLANGGIVERKTKAAARAAEKAQKAAQRKHERPPTPDDEQGVETGTAASDAEKKDKEEFIDPSDRLVAISGAGGILPLVKLVDSGTMRARENAAGALWHLALDSSNQILIAKCNGIAPLTTLLENGTDLSHKHAADALDRLALDNPENQAQIAKNLVGLLGNQNTGAQRRAAHALCGLATTNAGSPSVIVNAGAIFPLVNLLSSGVPEVKEEAASVLSTLSLNSPTNQLAIATGLVALVGTGSADSQEQVTQVLLTLAADADNRIAIAKAGAIPRLVMQIRGGSHSLMRAQELAASMLAKISGDSDENIAAIASASGIRPLIVLLSSSSSSAQAYAASVLADVTKKSIRNQNTVLAEGGIPPLIVMLAKESPPETKAEAAGALLCLASVQPELQKAVADAGAVKPLVALLNEEHDLARMKAAGALAAISNGSVENQEAVDKFNGITKLISLLGPTIHDEVRGQVAAALAVLARGNKKNQDKIASSGGVVSLVALLHDDTSSAHAKEEAAAALWSLSVGNYENQCAIADAGGIAPLVAVLGLESVRAQEQAASALAALALDNAKNELSIAKLIVSLLRSDEKAAAAKAARAISRLARAHKSNQISIAKAGGITLLVELINADEAGVGQAPPYSAALVEGAKVQKEMASAIWSMTYLNPENQVAIAKAGGIPSLIGLLNGHPEVHRDVSGALWSLADNANNQKAISDSGGITPLVNLLSSATVDAQETVAGALHILAKLPSNRQEIADAGAIKPLVGMFNTGSDLGKEQAACALETLVKGNDSNKQTVSYELVDMLRTGSRDAQGHVTALLRTLAQDPDNRGAVAKAGAVPELVKQLERGTERAMAMASQALALIALKSTDHRAQVTQELVKLLASDNAAVRRRSSEALREMAADETPNSRKNVSAGGGAPLINLLKEGLKDGRVEAQEYALWSLSAISETPAWRVDAEAIVEAGGIKPLIASLVGGKLSVVAQEHAAAVLSGLAPIGSNAQAIRAAKGIDPLVQLLLTGNAQAKEHSAVALAQLALRAQAALEIAKAGAVSAFVTWLWNPTLGPPLVAARALSEIALDNPDTQAQMTEEGAISPLVAMVASAAETNRPEFTANMSPQAAAKKITAALQVSNTAAKALATLAKGSVVIQTTVAEENGIIPLVDLLKNSAMKPIGYENATKALWHLAATEDNQLAIARAGGLVPLVQLLTTGNEITKQYAAAALESLSRDCTENQIALSKAGAIQPLVDLLGNDSVQTQEHAVGALLFLASHDAESRNSVVKRLVAVLEERSAAAQMKSAEALAVLASRNAENRKAITAAGAIKPLVTLLGDGRRAKEETPQERSAAVLADLAKYGENKLAIVEAGGVPPLVAMLSLDACVSAQTHSSGAIFQLAALGGNREAIVKAGGITQLVALLSKGSPEAKKYSAGALWHLNSVAENKEATFNAGAIPPLVAVLNSKSGEAREYASGVLSILARTQGGTKAAIAKAGGIAALVKLLADVNMVTQRHSACALWGLSDGKDGIYDKEITKCGAVQPLIELLQDNNPETRGFAAACLLCLCNDPLAKQDILEQGGAEPLLAFAHGPPSWLSKQCTEMLGLLNVPLGDPDSAPTLLPPPPAITQKGVQSTEQEGGSARFATARGEGGTARGAMLGRPSSPGRGPLSPKSLTARQRFYAERALASSRSSGGAPKMKYHFFSFQIHHLTGYTGFT